MKISIVSYAVFIGLFFAFIDVPNAGWLKTNWPMTGFVQSLAKNDTIVFAGTDGMGAFLSKNKGETWAAINSGLTKKFIVTLSTSGTNLFAGTAGGVFKSTNNGILWSAMNTNVMNKSVKSLAFLGNNLFAGTDNGLFVTTNNGANWSAVNSGLTDTTIYSLAIIGKNLFAGTNNGVYLSTNSGSSWSPVNSGLTKTLVYSLAVSGTNLIAGTYYDGVYLSKDSGASWSSASFGIKSDYINSIAVSESYLFAGTNNGVYVSHSTGGRWFKMNDGLADTIVLSVIVSGSYLFAGTSHESIWRFPLSEVSVSNKKINRMVGNPVFTIVTPNRVNTHLTIDCSLPRIEDVLVNIYNPAGREIASIVNNRFNPGIYCWSWETAKIPSGCYTVALRTKTAVFTKSVPVVR
jgi:hypothetical protein